MDSIEKMAKIGATSGGGVGRLALSKEDKLARDLFVKWLKDLDLAVRIDDMGNIFGNRPGRHNNLSCVMSGSHLDSQPKGGRFDGTLGVMGALEVLRTLDEAKIVTHRPIAIVNWTNEEGTRFAPGLLGSGVWTGKFEKDWAYERTDAYGKELRSELEMIGYKGNPSTGQWSLHAYYELHIEQGPILEGQGKIIGSPLGVVCRHHYDVEVEGTANQVGPTPMEGRNGALCTAAEMVLKVNELPDKMGGNMVATVGRIENFPNSRNVIPAKVSFHIDIRSWDEDMAIRGWEDLQNDFQRIVKKRGCSIRMEITQRAERIIFKEKLVRRVLEIADCLGYPSHDVMVSGAGHDACNMSGITPTAMIFVPSIGGRSHAEAENTTWEDCEAGVNVLLHCVLQSASEE